MNIYIVYLHINSHDVEIYRSRRFRVAMSKYNELIQTFKSKVHMRIFFREV